MLVFCLHPVLSFLFPWPETSAGLAPTTLPAFSACRPGRVDPEQQEKLGLPKHPPCRASSFCTYQMEIELFGKSGWIPAAGSEEDRELCFPPRVTGVIRCRRPGLSQLSEKRGMLQVVRQTSLWGDHYS